MYYAISYKCQICGKLVVRGVIDIPEDEAVKRIEQAMWTRKFAENPYLAKSDIVLDPEIIHNCNGGGLGVAIFAGLAPTSMLNRK